MSKHFDLSGRVAVITGGARGIGLAAAQRMADAGADIAVVDRDADATAAAVRDIEARGRRALGCPIELTDECVRGFESLSLRHADGGSTRHCSTRCPRVGRPS